MQLAEPDFALTMVGTLYVLGIHHAAGAKQQNNEMWSFFFVE